MSQKAIRDGITKHSVAYFRLILRETRLPTNKHVQPKTRIVKEVGTVKILLNESVVPKTCENFKALCTHKKGYGYINSKIHHMVSGFGIYGGDIVERVEKKQLFDINDFTGLEWDADIKPHGAPTHLPMPSADIGLLGRAAYGPSSNRAEYVFEEEFRFEDENFELSHDRPGVITMANTGPDSNNSNFVILTHPAPWLDGKNVAFGEVDATSMRMIHKLVNKMGSDSGTPKHDVYISQAGLLDHPEQDIPDMPEYKLSKKPHPHDHGRPRIYHEPYKYTTV